MIWVGQFGIVAGEAKEETPWVGAFRDPVRSDEASDLYMVVEPALLGSEEFCAEMKDAIGKLYHNSKVAVTGGVLQALRSAHENLREWNRRSIKEHRVAAGISCAAVRGHEIYLAQVAPAAAVFYRNGAAGVLRPTLPDAQEPLGLHDEMRPDFTRFELAEDDRLLLLSSNLAEKLEEQELTEALSLLAEDALPALYRRARELPDCAAVLIAGVPDAPDEAEAA